MAQARRSNRPLPRPRMGTLFFVGLLAVTIVLFVAIGPAELARILYGPIGGLILVIMVVEYLVLKSMDRTRVLEIENARLRRRSRDQGLLLREAREVLQEAAAAPDALPEELAERVSAVAKRLASGQ